VESGGCVEGGCHVTGVSCKATMHVDDGERTTACVYSMYVESGGGGKVGPGGD